MITHSRFSIPIILAAGMILAATLSCNFETREPMTITYEQYYSIDPPSLLKSLDQNGDTPFLPVEDRPDLPPQAQQIPVAWKQADYMHIVNALFTDIWGETTDGWFLNSMYFALGCTKIDNGFQNADFRYFRNEQTQEQEARIERYIAIDPRSKSIYVEERIYSPQLVDLASVDLKQLNFSADDVLVLAESNGGKEKRLAVDNVCDITLSLSPGSASYRGWNVSYSNSDVSNLFEMWVDPITGEIHSP